MKEEMFERCFDMLKLLVVLGIVLPLIGIVYSNRDDKTLGPYSEKEAEAIILVPEGYVSALWSYQQLPMSRCSWCGKGVNLNRHHIVPQSANPSLRDVRDNLVVLCRDCHFVLGHRCDWKQYNPDVLYICTHFTNCVRSADTRKGIETPRQETNSILHVTNDVPQKQQEALERILKWETPCESKSTP